MPRVKQVIARKDYPANGVKKGDTCYVWSRKTGPRSSVSYRQLTPPTRSQLTGSNFWQQVYGLFDSTKPDCPEDVRSMAEELRNIGQEAQDAFDNMPDGLQQGDTGQLLEERASSCEEKADELDTIADEWENAESEYETAKQEYDTAKAAFDAEQLTLSEDEEGELDEPEEPEEVDADDFKSRVSDCEPDCG